MNRLCKRCGETKDAATDFYPSQNGACITCKKKVLAAWYQRNSKAISKACVERRRLTRSGITPEAYTAKVIKQKGLCALCHKPPKDGKVLYADHDHLTGANRDLLCQHCNTMLGFANDDPEVLRAAAKYIIKHRKPATEPAA